jgi:hypothetical protein
MSFHIFGENLRRMYELVQLLCKNLRKNFKNVLLIFKIVFNVDFGCILKANRCKIAYFNAFQIGFRSNLQLKICQKSNALFGRVKALKNEA